MLSGKLKIILRVCEKQFVWGTQITNKERRNKKRKITGQRLRNITVTKNVLCLRRCNYTGGPNAIYVKK